MNLMIACRGATELAVRGHGMGRELAGPGERGIQEGQAPAPQQRLKKLKELSLQRGTSGLLLLVLADSTACAIRVVSQACLCSTCLSSRFQLGSSQLAILCFTRSR